MTKERRENTLDPDVRRAQAGDQAALESVVTAVQQQIYVLALRFLWHPADAEDATQEIIVRIIKGLNGYQGNSLFQTWVYRIACNSLITMAKKRMELQDLTFEEFGEDLLEGLSDGAPAKWPGVDTALLLEEVKIGCTQAMLLCLDRSHRLAYILGEIMGLDHREASRILDVSPQAYRKRLSRARQEILSFMKGYCGLTHPSNGCRCARRVDRAIDLGRVTPSRLLFASNVAQARNFPTVLRTIRKLEETRRVVSLFRSHSSSTIPPGLVSQIKTLIEGEGGD